MPKRILRFLTSLKSEVLNLVAENLKILDILNICSFRPAEKPKSQKPDLQRHTIFEFPRKLCSFDPKRVAFSLCYYVIAERFHRFFFRFGKIGGRGKYSSKRLVDVVFHSPSDRIDDHTHTHTWFLEGETITKRSSSRFYRQPPKKECCWLIFHFCPTIPRVLFVLHTGLVLKFRRVFDPNFFAFWANIGVFWFALETAKIEYFSPGSKTVWNWIFATFSAQFTAKTANSCYFTAIWHIFWQLVCTGNLAFYGIFFQAEKMSKNASLDDFLPVFGKREPFWICQHVLTGKCGKYWQNLLYKRNLSLCYESLFVDETFTSCSLNKWVSPRISKIFWKSETPPNAPRNTLFGANNLFVCSFSPDSFRFYQKKSAKSTKSWCIYVCIRSKWCDTWNQSKDCGRGWVCPSCSSADHRNENWFLFPIFPDLLIFFGSFP